jgi:Fic family protein
LLYDLLKQDNPITEQKLFTLHQAVQTSIVVDIYQPIGAWKCEPNGTYALTSDNKQTFIDYTTPSDVPALMTEWLVMLNDALALTTMDSKIALAIYSNLHLAFVRIHSFADCNGRMVCLIDNLHVLKSGLPPILIDHNRRCEYLIAISAYDIEVRYAKKDSPLLPNSDLKNDFIHFCKECWQSSIDLVEEIHARQKIRNRNQ